MTLDSIIGQTVPVSILRRALKSQTLGHAYLFSGEAGLGKETTARAAAQELMQQGGPLSELRVMTGKESIGVDEIRALRRRASYASSGCKIWIIKDVERMTIPASNGFLKTLEEPGKDVHFFLTTTKPHSLLPTIVSRCQHLVFRAVAEGEISKWLAEKTGLTAGDLKIQTIARLAQGSLGKAWEYWEGPLLEHRAEVIEKLVRIPAADFPEILGMSLSWPEDRAGIALELQWFLEWYRDLLVVKNEIDLSLYNPDYRRDLQRISTDYSNSDLFSIIQEITKTSPALVGNARIRFHVGYLLLLMKKGALT